MRESIHAGDMSLTVEDTGAEPVSLIVNGKERLWQNENGAWAGHAPLLFPVCGNCKVKIGGVVYPVPRHGFARRAPFALTEKRENALRYELADSEETRAVYPFPFRISVSYSLAEGCLTTIIEVRNTGKTPLVFSLGAHPCFALDDDPTSYELIFAEEERLLHRMHDASGSLTGETRDFGTGNRFRIPAGELEAGRTLIFGNVRSRSVTLRRLSGETVAEYAFEGYSHLLLWRPEGAHALCIEPWGNLPSAEGESCEFADKTGVTVLAAGKSRTFTQQMRFGSCK